VYPHATEIGEIQRSYEHAENYHQHDREFRTVLTTVIVPEPL